MSSPLRSEDLQCWRHSQQGVVVGLFSGFKDTLAKSQAAVVIQNLLEKHQDFVGLEASPAALANKMVEVTWRSSADLFDGKKSGKRAHKVAIAAYALAAGAHGASEKGNERFETAFLICLGEILRAVEASPRSFQFHDIDHSLLARAMEIFVERSTDPKYAAVDAFLKTGT